MSCPATNRGTDHESYVSSFEAAFMRILLMMTNAMVRYNYIW